MKRKHVVIVGGSKGLGRVLTDRFLQEKFMVSVISRENPSNLGPNANLNHIEADLNSNIDKPLLYSKLFSFSEHINYLIFCQRYRGGIDDWQGEIQVGLTATRNIIDLSVALFSKEHDSSIVVVSSVYAQFIGSSQQLSYHVVKGGLNQLIRYYAWYLGKDGIRVNGIMPLTYIKPETRNYYSQQEMKLSLYKRFVPLQRLGEASDSANVIEFLCSEKSSFITGQCIYVDGGLSVVWPEELGLGRF